MRTVTQVKTDILGCIRRGEHEMEASYPYENPLNDYQRELIEAFAREHGEAWVGNVNLYGDERHTHRPLLKKWDGELVRNFAVRFVVPRYDSVLEDMIRERDNAPYTGTTDDYARVVQIHDRIIELGGELLIWN